MHDQTVHIVSQAIRYMEDHLHDKLDLETVAAALLYLRIILRGTATNGTFPIVPVFNQSSRQNGSKFQYPILSYHSRLSSTDGLRFSQSVHSKAER